MDEFARGERGDLCLAVAERREERARVGEEGFVRLWSGEEQPGVSGGSRIRCVRGRKGVRERETALARRTSTDLSMRLTTFCSSTSIQTIRSLVLPTTMYRPSGDHAIVMLSPWVSTTDVGFEPSASENDSGRGSGAGRAERERTGATDVECPCVGGQG